MATAKKTTPSRTIRVYKSYNFKNKDPIIDKVRTIIQDSGKSYDEIEADSGVTTQTLRNWFGGPTKRPQFATANAALRAVGYELAPVRMTISKRDK